MEAVCWSIGKIFSSSWLLKSHWSWDILTGIYKSVHLSVLEIGWSFFLTFTLMMEVKMQFLAGCKNVIAHSPLTRYSDAPEILGLQSSGKLSLTCLLVKVNLWLLCDLIVQLNSLEIVPQAPETIFISSLFLVSVKDILSELGFFFIFFQAFCLFPHFIFNFH